MIQVRKAYVLVLAGLLASLFTVSASAAFGFSSPLTTIVAGPGLAAAGPTTFNTYSHTANMANAVAQADAAVNGIGGWGCGPYGVPFGCGPCDGGFSPVPGCLPAIPWGFGGYGPAGVANVANELATSNCGTDNTFATSFSTAGGGLPFGACNFAGQFPEFSVNFF